MIVGWISDHQKAAIPQKMIQQFEIYTVKKGSPVSRP